MANYTVNITNGTGSQDMKAGSYNVVLTSAPGYETTTLSPTTYTVGTSAGSGTFTVSASGTLTIVVNETGAAGGTPVTSGTIVMTDSTGNTEYGSAVTISASGEAVFDNVPYGSSETPYALYFKQLTSDDGHNVYDGVITVNMTSNTQTEYVQNTAIATQSMTLSDANYSGLPVNSAVMSFSNE